MREYEALEDDQLEARKRELSAIGAEAKARAAEIERVLQGRRSVLRIAAIAASIPEQDREGVVDVLVNAPAAGAGASALPPAATRPPGDGDTPAETPAAP